MAAAAPRNTLANYAALFTETAYAPSDADLQAFYTLHCLHGRRCQHLHSQIRLIFNIIKVNDIIGPSRSQLAGRFVGMEGDLDSLITQAATFVNITNNLMNRAPAVGGLAPTVAHMDAVIAAAPNNGAGYLHAAAPAAADADHTELRVRYLQPVPWEKAKDLQ
eukprot:CAMPEP_0178683714 /NCGR_PEP_ID=MMETSP0699-20121125/2453_1 /TAXON_ID=265572 /ORGANISM="Extubocellulus spinifer, Strain CCMP396" /LENGTH=162 /DNA_ID=CAMNT_0020328331 /DNA_START=230 /DNA_END=720 /DNA_ORIENTATION=+